MGRLMLKIADLLILPRTFANPREELRNCLMLLMRTERIMNECKDWLINFKLRSKLTRSKLKRLKKVLTLMNKPLPKQKLRDVQDPLSQCKEQEVHHLIKTCSPMLLMAL